MKTSSPNPFSSRREGDEDLIPYPLLRTEKGNWNHKFIPVKKLKVS
jgi:hypothetical protein